MIDFAELKCRAGVRPFASRIQLDGDYSPCPFHQGDGDKAFHVLAKKDGSVIGTCFSQCSNGARHKTWDVISFVEDFDKVPTVEAVRRINAEIGTSACDVVI